MSGVETLTQALADYLSGQGARVRTAWEAEERSALTGPTAVVSLRGGQVSPAGFQDYLGQRKREDTGGWEELYGRQARLTFGLDLYAPEGTGDEAVRQELDRLSSALLAGGPEGLAVEEFSWGELAFDSAARLLKRPAQVVCRAYLLRAEQEDGLFTDFELRGGLKV